ncbi:MAG: SCO family protein, partial [Spirochaetia bacterium]|nr:SCO family protein [Spirochaetia bacterium]
MKNRIAWLFIGAVILVPLAIFLTFEHGIPKKLSVFGKGPLPDFSLKDQQGRTFTQKDLEGKIVVADFFFASCTTICPKMSVNMGKAQERFKGNAGGVVFLSISVDPERDTVEVLKDYGRRYGAD